jgi:two-component system KDP operon response regulator KdpE
MVFVMENLALQKDLRETEGMKKKRILIVDDDPDIQRTLKRRLGSQGYECTATGTVSAGLMKLREELPDLVVLDLGFPGPNGTAFLENAKNYLPAGSKVPPILVLSCYNERETMDYVLNEGASVFISKPYDPAHLNATIRSLLNIE